MSAADGDRIHEANDSSDLVDPLHGEFRVLIRNIVAQSIQREQREGPGSALAWLDAVFATTDIAKRATNAGSRHERR